MAELYERELFVFNQVPVKIFNHFFERGIFLLLFTGTGILSLI